jgi:hypothetical protein
MAFSITRSNKSSADHADCIPSPRARNNRRDPPWVRVQRPVENSKGAPGDLPRVQDDELRILAEAKDRHHGIRRCHGESPRLSRPKNPNSSRQILLAPDFMWNFPGQGSREAKVSAPALNIQAPAPPPMTLHSLSGDNFVFHDHFRFVYWPSDEFEE